MRQHNYKLLPLLAVLLAVTSPALSRRVRVKPQPVVEENVDDQEPRSQRLQYYTAAEAADAGQGQQFVVVAAGDDPYSGLYGRQSISRQSEAADVYRPRHPAAKAAGSRARDTPKQPPVQTLRNYNKVNDDGSFTFGYEAADGSFKEETRGTDCVVRGKYGYVDPDGNKREFTYVSGNPCDPNAPSEEEEKDLPDSGEENIPRGPAGRPLRPRPASLAPARPTTTVFQNNYVQEEEAEAVEPQQVLYTPSPRPVTARPTTIYHTQPETARPVTVRPTHQPSVRITPRPYSASTTVRSQLPATTYRPRGPPSPTPRPGVVYSNTIQPSPTPHHVSSGAVDFEETLRQFQLENNVLTTARPHASRPTARPQAEPLAAGKGNALYETQLVYDPATGQYNTVFYQNVPQTSDNISLRQRIQPYQQAQNSFQSRPQIPQQQVYQQQQALVLQRSQQLYAQQQQRQRALAQQQPQTQSFPSQYYQQQLAKEPTRQQFYYVSPTTASRERDAGASHGQIDAFLRGHNIAF